MSKRPTAEQATADPKFRKGDVDIVAHPPAHSDGRDADAARPPRVTGRD